MTLFRDLSLRLAISMLISISMARGRNPTTSWTTYIPAQPVYQTFWFDQVLDHFNFQITTKWQQRYLVADEWWGKQDRWASACPGPVFFYCGNEGPVDNYYNNTGLYTQVLAPQYGALLIYAEHRYFGESLPFGNNSYRRNNIGYLSTDQALADYAVLLTAILPQLGAQDCPVFAFGGSYGARLASLMRIKYPNIVMGAHAASAPWDFYDSGIPLDAFSVAATATYAAADPDCPSVVSEAFEELGWLIGNWTNSSPPTYWTQISQELRLCSPITNATVGQAVNSWMVSGFQHMAMMDYPYACNYSGYLTAWPVNQSCAALTGSGSLFSRIATALGNVYNATGTEPCYELSPSVPYWQNGWGWPYLACTCNYAPQTLAGMFPAAPFNLTKNLASCLHTFGVTTQPYWSILHWGGIADFTATTASNIIFSNGLLDPWHTSGILQNISETVVAIVIPAAAHHLDLRGPSEADPVYVTEARRREGELVGLWLDAWFQQHSTTGPAHMHIN